MRTTHQDALDPAIAELMDMFTEASIMDRPGQKAEEPRGEIGDVMSILRGPLDHDVLDRVSMAERFFDSSAGPVYTRVYTPRPLRGVEVTDTVVYLHSGYGVLGRIADFDPDVRRMAAELCARVVAVEYRLAPEHPFPAGMNDVLAVVNELAEEEHVTLSLAGDCTGATIALSVAFSLRDSSSVELDALLLMYPMLDPDAVGNASYEEHGGKFVTSEYITSCYASYLGEASTDPIAVPARMDDLTGLPAIVLATAGHDPAHDEGRDFAARLVAQDVPTVYLPNPTMFHAFAQVVPRVPAAVRALTTAYAAFRSALDSVQKP